MELQRVLNERSGAKRDINNLGQNKFTIAGGIIRIDADPRYRFLCIEWEYELDRGLATRCDILGARSPLLPIEPEILHIIPEISIEDIIADLDCIAIRPEFSGLVRLYPFSLLGKPDFRWIDGDEQILWGEVTESLEFPEAPHQW